MTTPRKAAESEHGRGRRENGATGGSPSQALARQGESKLPRIVGGRQLHRIDSQRLIGATALSALAGFAGAGGCPEADHHAIHCSFASLPWSKAATAAAHGLDRAGGGHVDVCFSPA